MRRNLFLVMALIGLTLLDVGPLQAAQPTALAEPCKYRDQMAPVIQATSELFTQIAVLSQKTIKGKVNHLIKVSVDVEFATNEIDDYQNDKPLAHRLSIPLGEAWTDAQTAAFARDSQKDAAGFSHYLRHGEASVSRAWRILGDVACSTPLIQGGVPSTPPLRPDSLSQLGVQATDLPAGYHQIASIGTGNLSAVSLAREYNTTAANFQARHLVRGYGVLFQRGLYEEVQVEIVRFAGTGGAPWFYGLAGNSTLCFTCSYKSIHLPQIGEQSVAYVDSSSPHGFIGVIFRRKQYVVTLSVLPRTKRAELLGLARMVDHRLIARG